MNDYLDQINVKGVLYTISGGTGGGVTSGEVQTMLEDYTYDKETIDDKISSGGGSSSAVTVLSGDVITISGDVIELSESLDKVSGDVIVLSGDVKGLETKIDTLSGKVDDKQDKLTAGQGISISDSNVISTSGSVTDILPATDDTFGRGLHIWQMGGSNPGLKTIAEGYDGIIISRNNGEPSVYSGKIRPDWNVIQRKLSAGTGIDITDNIISVPSGDVIDIVSAYTYSKDEIDEKVASGGTFDPTLYYKKTETSGKTELDTEFAKYYKKTETSSKTEIDSAFSAITKVIEDNEEVISGALNDLNDKKVESGDVIDIVSGYTYDKNEIDAKIASGGSITSGDVQTMIDESISGKTNNSDFSAHTADTSIHLTSGDVVDIVSGYTYDKDEINSKINNAISEVIIDVDYTVSADTQPIKNDIAIIKSKDVTNVTYDSVNKVINFYNTNGVLVDSIDATDFIKDGMVQDVQIITEGGVSYLRITFNTESGQENINIDLSQIFDANNYYTKTEVNNIISNKIQCLSEAEWARTSGSTQSDVLYLIY